MKCIAVDDESVSLELLNMAIKEASPDADVESFDNPRAALEYVKNHSCDVAFLDIYMKEMLGTELAKRLKTYNSKINIIFVTGDEMHMKDALELHASGYLVKPVLKDEIENEMQNLLHEIDVTKVGIYAHTFGNFDLYINGKVVTFEREKAKELLAILIDKGGASLTTEQIATILYEDKGYSRNVKNQVTSIVSSLCKSLRNAGIEDILVKSWGHLQIDKSKIVCDAYDYWKGIPYALNQFHGEYMNNYSWAEEKTAEFYWNEKDNR